MTRELGFSYLLAHPAAAGVSVDRPEWLILLLAAPVFFMWRGKGSERLPWAVAARSAAYVLVVLALAGLSLTARLPDDRLSVVAAVDVSESIDARGRRWQQRYLQEVAAALAPGDELGVVAFASETVILQSPGSTEAGGDLEEVGVRTTATDISRALETALLLLPPDTERRLLLLSDGNETRGSALSMIPRARRSQTRIYAAVPPHAGGADIAVQKVLVPPLVAEGTVFPVRVTLRNRGKAREAALELSIDDTSIGRERIALEPGLNAIEIPYRVHGIGSRRLRAEIHADNDALAGNNYREADLVVGGKMRLLLVSTRKRSPLARVLERKDFEVVATSPRRFPRRASELRPYHAVILEDVAAASLKSGKLSALRNYVRDYGGGLIVAAGERTYGDAGFRRTPLQAMLPVTLEPRQPPRAQRAPLALFLLIDRSNSMGYHFRKRLERSQAESKLVYARHAALAVIDQLRENDMVGVIAFDSLPFEVSPLVPVRDNREALRRQIPRLQPGGGTDFYDALASARDQLRRARTETRHMILLTDGETNRGAADHDPLVASLAKAGISVTTIRVGHDTSNVRLLQEISRRTGGQFYHAESAATLPELMLKDTSQALTHAPRSSQRFSPVLVGPSAALQGIDQNDLPPLHGYAYARPKRQADVLVQVLTRERKDPILAVWQYGLGRVVAYTASPQDDAEAWIGWEGLGKFWSQLAHWTVREHTPQDYAVRVRRAEREIAVTVDTFADVGDTVLLARLQAHPERILHATLVPRTPRRFFTRLPPIPGGRYPLTIIERRSSGGIRETTQVVTVPDSDEEPQEEYLAHGPNRALLEALSSATGGAVNASLRDLVAREPGTRQLRRRLDWWLAPLAMLLFLTDVGLRRYRAATER
jgi:Mg-chelatase subunit ChlD